MQRNAFILGWLESVPQDKFREEVMRLIELGWWPHMCQDDHEPVGWSGDDERCPVCRMRDEMEARSEYCPFCHAAPGEPCSWSGDDPHPPSIPGPRYS